MELYYGLHFESDLVSIKSNPFYQENDDDLINAFILQIADSDEALWTLTKRKDSYHSLYFNQSEIVWMQRAGYNLYRIRPLLKKLQQYRILYAYNGQKDEIHLLALVIKKPDSLPAHLTNGEYYDYESNHRITQRIIDEYQTERFPMLH